MRITPVTGDLPAHAVPPPSPVRHAVEPGPAAAPVERTDATATDADAAARHRRPAGLPLFDPPLIAQRAVLGLPTGHLIAGLARSADIPYTAAAAAVDREMPPTDG